MDKTNLVLHTTFMMNRLANSLHLLPTHCAQSPPTYQVHSHSSPNTRINPNVVQNDEDEDDYDYEEECVRGRIG